MTLRFDHFTVMNNEKRKTLKMDWDDFTSASAAGDHERENHFNISMIQQ